MASSVSSTELLESGPVRSRLGPGRRRLLIWLGLAAVAAAAVAGGSLWSSDRPDATPPVRYVEAWIGAWNDRDTQALSSMTCDYIPAFTPAGIFEAQLATKPPGQPIVARYTVVGTQPDVAYDRTGVRVDLSYVPGGRDTPQEKSVFVRVRPDGDMCIGYFSSW